MGYVVNQASLLSAVDGSAPELLLAKMGLAPYMSKWDFLALQGRMFNTHEIAIGTAQGGSTAAAGAIVLTNPTVRLTVPTGLCLFPYNVNINLVSAAGVEMELAFVVSDSDSYTSGGASFAAYIFNWRTDDPRASAVTNPYYGSAACLEAALTNPRKYATAGLQFASAAANDQVNNNISWKFDDFIPCVGPCSVLLFLSAKTTALTYEFDMSWAEVPTVHV